MLSKFVLKFGDYNSFVVESITLILVDVRLSYANVADCPGGTCGIR